MLKEIRDNLKHLRREPENPNEAKQNSSNTQVVYRGNIPNSQHISNQHISHQHQGRFAQQNNFVDPIRNHHEQIQGNRNYDESGYSSSSSECSSQSTNDFNGHMVGNVEVSRFFIAVSLRSTCFCFASIINTSLCKNISTIRAVGLYSKRMQISLVYKSHCIENTLRIALAVLTI